MKTMSATMLTLLATTSQAFASGGTSGAEDLSLLAVGFISFGVLIVLFQFVPALLLIGGMLAGLFKSDEKKNGKDLARARRSA